MNQWILKSWRKLFIKIIISEILCKIMTLLCFSCTARLSFQISFNQFVCLYLSLRIMWEIGSLWQVWFIFFQLQGLLSILKSLKVKEQIRTRIFTGWGRTELGQKSDIKRKLEIEIRDSDYCHNAYRDTRLSRKQLCAGGVKNEASCSGDSGENWFQILPKSKMIF